MSNAEITWRAVLGVLALLGIRVLLALGISFLLIGSAGATVAFFLFFVGITLYVLPWAIAKGREHKNTAAICALNLLLGWTFIGWVVALVWALSN